MARTAAQPVMGTVASLAAPDAADPAVFAAAAAAAFDCLHEADALFSPFRADSAVSRLRDGRSTFVGLDEGLTPDQAAQVRAVLTLCARVAAESGGAFDAFAVGVPPVFDPSGIVKGWATQRAAQRLEDAGLSAYLLNVGGDIQARGGRGGLDARASSAGSAGGGGGGGGGGGAGRDGVARSDGAAAAVPWRIGIADPHRPGHTLTVFEIVDGAVATSGTAERGEHVWDARTGRPAGALVSVTVAGPDLALADGYATAALAMAGPVGGAGAGATTRGLTGGTRKTGGSGAGAGVGAGVRAGARAGRFGDGFADRFRSGDGRFISGAETAAGSGVEAARRWLAGLARESGYESFTVDADQGVWWSAGARRFAPQLPG